MTATSTALAATTELHRLNRTLAAYGHCNQALLHADSEPALLERICAIVTENCGYAMVWIGFAESDDKKSVRPVAHAGFEEGYLDAARISWADNERGSGPTGLAIRRGQPQLCRNMLTDPKFELWRKDALRRGYASSLVLPLILPANHPCCGTCAGPVLPAGKTFGAINIYSREADPFTADEVKLLTEMAADLAYGIGALRARAAHAQAEEALRRSAQFPEENPNPVLRIADSGMLLYANPPGRAFLRATRTSEKEPLPEGLQALVAEASRCQRPIEGELTDQDGHVFTFMAFRPQGEQYVNLYGTDITEHKRAEETIRELSTPVLPARSGFLIVPLIGTIDPSRARQLTEQLLTSIRQRRARVVVIDVTGVATIDTSVAHHLFQTAEACRLLGARIILTGVSTAVARTLVAVGVDLGGIKTLGDLQSGIEEANRLLDGNGRAANAGTAAKTRAAFAGG